MSWILNLIGGRVGGVLLLALIAALGWGWLQSAEADAERRALEQALADKAVITERLSQVAVTANENAAEAERARREAREREARVADLIERRAEDRAETENQVVQLTEVTRAAPDEYQTCVRVAAPPDVGRMLFAGDATPGSGDGSQDGVRDASRSAPGRLLDPAAGLGHAHDRGDRRAGTAPG